MAKKANTTPIYVAARMTKAQILSEYSRIRNSHEECGHYPPLKASATKPALFTELVKIAEEADGVDIPSEFTDVQAAPEQEQDEAPEQDGGADEAPDAGTDEAEAEDKVYLTEGEHAFLQHFTKPSMKVSNIQAKMEAEKENSGKAVHIRISGLEKKGAITQFKDKKDEKCAMLTAEGKAWKKADHEEKPATVKAAPKPFTPPFSEEDIKGAKKKKAKKMVAANEEALAEYNANKGKRTQQETPDHLKSNYQGTVPNGRWQDGGKGTKPSSFRAVLDLFEQDAFDLDSRTFLMNKKTFVSICWNTHAINEGNASTNWNRAIKENDVSSTELEQLKSLGTDLMEVQEAPQADKKSKKKGKKGKKGGKKA